VTPTVPTVRDRGEALQALATLLPTVADRPDAHLALRQVAAGLAHPGHETRLLPVLLAELSKALVDRTEARKALVAHERHDGAPMGSPYLAEVHASALARHLVWVLLEAPGLVPCVGCLVEGRPYADTHRGLRRADGAYRCAQCHGAECSSRHDIRVETAGSIVPVEQVAASAARMLARTTVR
jgi:hypothetical protein